MSRVVVVMSVLLAGLGWPVGAAAEEPPAAGTAEPGTITYQEALALVIQNSFELKLADEDVRDARRRVSRARRQYHPRIKVVGIARGDLLDVADWSGDQNFAAGMILDWAPFRNGELLKELAASRMGMTVATLKRRQAAADLEYEFLGLYCDILNAGDDAALAKLTRDLEEKKLEALERDVEADRAVQADVLKQKGTFFEADAAWRKGLQALELKLIELEQRTGLKDITGVGDVDRGIRTTNRLTPEDCVAAAQNTRIDLLIARETVRLADLGVKYAGLKRLPSVYFYTDSDYRLTEELGDRGMELRAGVTVSYPLYGAGDTAAAIADAKAAAVRARIQSSQMRLKAEQEIREAFWAYENDLRLLESVRERERVFEDDFTGATVLHERGALSDMEFMAAEIRYRESRKRVRTLELETLTARAALVRAVGVVELSDIVPAGRGDGPQGDAPGQKEAQ